MNNKLFSTYFTIFQIINRALHTIFKKSKIYLKNVHIEDSGRHETRFCVNDLFFSPNNYYKNMRERNIKLISVVLTFLDALYSIQYSFSEVIIFIFPRGIDNAVRTSC